MSEEEKKAIEWLKNLDLDDMEYTCLKCAYTENKGNCTVGNCFMKSQQLLLNLINNQQIAINKMAKDISSNLLELQKKDNIINKAIEYIE